MSSSSSNREPVPDKWTVQTSARCVLRRSATEVAAVAFKTLRLADQENKRRKKTKYKQGSISQDFSFPVCRSPRPNHCVVFGTYKRAFHMAANNGKFSTARCKCRLVTVSEVVADMQNRKKVDQYHVASLQGNLSNHTYAFLFLSFFFVPQDRFRRKERSSDD